MGRNSLNECEFLLGVYLAKVCEGLLYEKQSWNLFIKPLKNTHAIPKINHMLQANLFHQMKRNFAVEREQDLLTT